MIKRIVSLGSAVLACLAAVSAQAQSYSNAVMALNPAAYWPMTETTAPSSDGQYIATNSGSLGAAGNGYYETWWQTNGVSNTLTNMNSIVHIAGAIAGDSDTAMQQGVIGQYVVIPRTTNGVVNSAVTLTPPFSIEMWIFPTNGTASQLKPILAEGFNNVIRPDLNYTNTTEGTAFGMFGGFLYFNTWNGAGAKTEIDTGTLALNQWHHVVGTFDGTSQKLYLDGALVGTKTPPLNSFGQRYVADLVSPLVIGGGNELGLSGGANVLFGGGIDEVAIYNGTLSLTQVTNHFSTGTNSARLTPYSQVVGSDNPSIYLRLDEPAFTGPDATTSPVAANVGSLGASANGYYLPGTTPGVAGPTNVGFGVTSSAVALNGFNSGVDIGGGNLPSQLNPTNGQPMTITAWFKGNPADAVGRFQTIVGHSDSSWRLSMDTIGGERFNPGNGPELQFANVNEEVASGMFLNDGNWHFIAGVSDGTNDSLYLDGLLVKTGSNVGTVTNGSPQDVILGGDPQFLAPQATGGGGRWFDGSLAQVAFFTNALSTSQIQGMYAAAGVGPSIHVQPTSQALDAGTVASIPVIVSGSEPISYQWYKDGSVASGQTTSSLTFNPVATGNAGSYFLVANNSYGAVTSAVIQVTVFQPGSYSYAVRQLNPVAYWPLNETVQPPAGQYIATNIGTLGAAANGYYESWYQPLAIGATNTFFATNNIQHGAGGTGDGDSALLCGNATGAGQYVVFPRTTNGIVNSAVSITAPFTIEVWVRSTNTTSGVRPIVNEGRNPVESDGSQGFTNNFRGFSLGQFQGKFYFQVYNGLKGDNNGVPELDANNVVSNAWYHLVVTYDGTTETMYTNGVIAASASATYAPDALSPLLIGTGTDLPAGNGGSEFSGAIDDVAIYNTALSQAQIQAHFAAVGAGYSATVLADSPNIYLRLDEPAFNNYPSPATYPVATNYGTLGAAANALYQPGTTPGAAGPTNVGFGATSTAVAINGFYGAVDVGGGITPPQLNPTGKQPQTIAAWFRANPVDARFQEIASRGDTSWRLTFDAASLTAPDANRYNPGNGPELQFTNFTDVLNNGFLVNDGNWHFVAGVSDGTNASMYIDGALAKTASGVGSLAGSGMDALIGGSPAHVTPSFNSANIRYFNGQIAQVAYFTNALSVTQIQQMYGAAGVPLSIVLEPQDATFNSGSAASLSVGVRGSSPMYQWYSTNINTGVVTPVAGQTNASLAFNPATLSNSGFYFVIATNTFGSSVTSSAAQLTIVGPPVITQSSPTDLRVFVGTTPTLHLTVNGPSPIFQWSSNNVPIPNATNSAYTLTTADTGTPGTISYACIVTNTFGSLTDTVSVAVLQDPTAPFPAAVLADRPVNYFRLNEPDSGYPNNGVTAYDYAGGDNGSYSNTDLGLPGYSVATDAGDTSAAFGQHAGQDSYMGNVPPYLDFATPAGSNAQFSVEAWVNASFGQVFDAGIVTVGYGFGGEQFNIDTGANETTHPLRFYVNSANNVNYKINTTFDLSANPGWHHIVAICDEAGGHLYLYIDGTLAGSTVIPSGAGLRNETAPLSIGSRLSTATATDYDNQFFGGIDDVAIYNYALSAAQVQAHYFTAGIAPVITQVSPSSVTTNQNSTVAFTVTATGTAPLSYQWFNPSSVAIPNQTNATLVLSNVQPSQNGSYSVTVTNPYGSASTNATLTVNQGPPIISTDLTPTNLTVFAGSQVTYSVFVTGTPPFAYQWFENGVAVPNATNSSYTFAALLGTNTYFVTVTNSASAGTPTVSSTATVVGMPSTTLNPANYTDRIKITFSGYNRGETLMDFPILVKLSTAIPGFDYSHFASGTGGDLRFTDAGGTRVIPHEIDEWVPGGVSTVWVQMPALSGTNDFIWAYWGNPSDTTAPSGTNVWLPQPFENVPSYQRVYHLKEGAFPFVDSTRNHDVTNGVAAGLTNGIIGTAGAFDGTDRLDAGTNDLGDAFTMSAWVNIPTTTTDIQTLWANFPGGFGGAGMGLWVDSFKTADQVIDFGSGNGAGGGNESKSPGGTVPFGDWHLVTVAINRTNGTGQFYLDGNNVASSVGIVKDFNTLNDLVIGSFIGGGSPFHGAMDEARIRSSVNSSNWVWATWATVAQNSTLESYSSVTSSVVSVTPVTIQFSTAAGNLILSGSGGAGDANLQYYILSSTNLNLPLAQWTPVITNNFNNNGDFSNAVPIDATKPSQYFEIVIP